MLHFFRAHADKNASAACIGEQIRLRGIISQKRISYSPQNRRYWVLPWFLRGPNRSLSVRQVYLCQRSWMATFGLPLVALLFELY